MLYERLTCLADRSFFLLGVRGVGKSTWVRSALPPAMRFDLLDEALFTDLLADPALFGRMLSTVGAREWIVVGEVQRLPSLHETVKMCAGSGPSSPAHQQPAGEPGAP